MTARTRYCGKCGRSTVDTEDKFCRSCGSDLVGTNTERSTAHASTRNFASDVQSPNTLESKPWKVIRHFLPIGRSGRVSFLLTIVLLYGLVFLAGAIVGFLNPDITDEEINTISDVSTVPLVLLYVFQMVKRLHDFGRSAWNILLFLIPLWSLFELFKLIFIRGNKGPNVYDD